MAKLVSSGRWFGVGHLEVHWAEGFYVAGMGAVGSTDGCGDFRRAKATPTAGASSSGAGRSPRITPSLQCGPEAIIAAFERGEAQITLSDGEKLPDLLIQ
jgi:hypothetical protein